MKEFFKYLLASFISVIIAGIFLLFIFMGIIGSKFSGEEEPVEIEKGTVLKMNLNSPIKDKGKDFPSGLSDIARLNFESTLGLDDILENIEKATNDEKISGIYLKLSSIPTGISTIKEIRNALVKFKESGKFVIAHGDYMSQSAYYLASVANEIYLTPTGAIQLAGLNAEIMFYTGFLEKIGVEPQIIRHGKFKSAIEPFIRKDLSDENREQINSFLSNIWKVLSTEIAESRKLSQEQFKQYVDEIVADNPEKAVEAKLIDGVKYEDEILSMLKEKTEAKSIKDLKFIGISKYTRVPKENKKKKGLAKDKIAVVYASGGIVMDGDDDKIVGERFAKAIREARTDEKIKAIVLRVNSGGGSALASDLIWREIGLAKKEKPVIASFGDVAASGGYYIACNADTILAEPTTITGSIGVFGMFFTGKKLLNDKLGITTDNVKTNKLSDMGSNSRALRPEERLIIKRSIEKVYDDFIGRVAEGRRMTKEQIDAIAQGRVWSGVKAKEIGLVDEFGGLKEAIALAAEKAKLENYRTVDYPKEKDPIQQLLDGLSGQASFKLLGTDITEEINWYKKVKELTENQGIQARIPYEMRVY